MNHVTLLRDGSEVADPRLGRIPQPDPRNSNYPIRALLDVTRPLRSYTWNCYARLDQGQQGSCVGHGFAHELAARPAVVPGVTHELAVDFYYQAQREDPWPGGEYPGASPIYSGTSVLTGAKVLANRGYYSGYRWAESESDVARAVAYHGPVVMGTDWYVDMMDPDPAGWLHDSGGVVGGHCWLLIGFSVRRDGYRMLNSWGHCWGADGTASIKREAVSRLLANGGEACLPVRNRRP